LPTWDKHGYRAPGTAGALSGIASVGANWVQIVPTWYQVSRTTSEIQPTASTVDDDDVRRVVELARDRGLKVLLKPHVDIADGEDRAHISPTDRDAWFSSYHRFITHYAELATELGVEEFAVGTELAGVSDDRQRWLGVIADIRKAYRGELVYAANHYNYAAVSFWDAVDLIGIDAYWPLSDEPTADVERLRRAYEVRRDALAEFAARVDRRILFTEAGFPSQRGAATAPWSGTLNQRPAQDEQAAAYEALLATFSGQPWWAGVYFWTWSVDYARVNERDHSVWGKASQSVLHRWWAPGLGSRAAGSAVR
jgi:hypothetical protein